jgi:hypothetical protein
LICSIIFQSPCELGPSGEMLGWFVILDLLGAGG